MPFSPDVQQLIQQVKRLSDSPVHVMEEADLRNRATVTPARGGTPGHIIRFRPGSSSLDYLVASQLQFLIRTFTCPPTESWAECEAHAAQLDALWKHARQLAGSSQDDTSIFVSEDPATYNAKPSRKAKNNDQLDLF